MTALAGFENLIVHVKADGSDRLARIMKGEFDHYLVDARGELVTGAISGIRCADGDEADRFEAIEIACARADIVEQRGPIALFYVLRRVLTGARLLRALEDVESELKRRGKTGRESQVACVRLSEVA